MRNGFRIGLFPVACAAVLAWTVGAAGQTLTVRSLADGLQEYGIATELKSERLPGERPVERREGTTATRRTARRTIRKRPIQQQRRLAK